jgi:hypothetical protein
LGRLEDTKMEAVRCLRAFDIQSMTACNWFRYSPVLRVGGQTKGKSPQADIARAHQIVLPNQGAFWRGVWREIARLWGTGLVLGAWLALGGANTLHFLVRSRTVLVFGLAYLLFAAVMTLSGLMPELQKLSPQALFEAFNPNDKTNLAPYRFLHLVVRIILGARFIAIDAAGLQAAIWKPLVKCGQQSLEVFAVGIYLSFIGYIVLQMTSSGIIAQLLVGTGGISIMTAVAYHRSWSEKHAYGHANQPAVQKPHAPADEPVQPGHKALVGTA